MGKHYLYRHIRKDTNNPFYIGIGTKSKDEHRFYCDSTEYRRAFNFKNRNSFWKNIYNKCDQGIDVEILYESDSLDEINRKEIEFIDMYGRREHGGTLCNIQKGGLVYSGWKLGKSTREKISKSASNRPKRKTSDKTKELLRTIFKGRKPSESNIMAVRLSSTGRKASKETRDKLSEAKRGRKFSDEHKKRISDALKGYTKSPEHYFSTIKHRKIIGQYNIDGILVDVHLGAKNASKSVNGTQGKILECVNGKRGKHKGYIWREIGDPSYNKINNNT